MTEQEKGYLLDPVLEMVDPFSHISRGYVEFLVGSSSLLRIKRQVDIVRTVNSCAVLMHTQLCCVDKYVVQILFVVKEVSFLRKGVAAFF